MPDTTSYIDFKNLAAHKDTFLAAATRAYSSIVGISAETRGDSKERTGIWVLLAEPNTRNVVKFPVGTPSDVANHFCSEKAARSALLGDYSSTNSRVPELFQFSGSITIPILIDRSDNTTILLQGSISGLQEPEDVAASIMIFGSILPISHEQICRLVMECRGELPDELLKPGNYLNELLFPKAA